MTMHGRFDMTKLAEPLLHRARPHWSVGHDGISVRMPCRAPEEEHLTMSLLSADV